MDKNSVIGLVLISVLLFGYATWQNSLEVPNQNQSVELYADSTEQQTAQPIIKESINNEAKMSQMLQAAGFDSTTDSLINLAKQRESVLKFGVFFPATQGNSELITLENEEVELLIDTKGAALKSARLKNFTTYAGEPLFLFKDDSTKFNIKFFYPEKGEISLSDLYFEPTLSSASDGVSKVLEFRSKSGINGEFITVKYSLPSTGFDLNFNLDYTNAGSLISSTNRTGKLDWSIYGIANEKGVSYERTMSTVMFRYFEKTRDYLSETKADSEVLESETQWVAFKQRFFSAITYHDKGFLPNESRIEVIPYEATDRFTKYYNANLVYPIDNGLANFNFYLGPNQYNILRAKGMGMERIIDLGWGIFGWMNIYLVIPIFNLLDGFNMGYGIIILILTFIIKGLLFPLTYKNYLSSAKMKVLRPEIENINKKFSKSEDAMKKQQAVMGLYRETGVNPLAGCIPMLIQLPILYAMFRFFPASIELRQESFLWADDLSSYDSILSLPFSIPFYGDHVSLFTILMAGSTILYTRMNSGNLPDTTQPGMPNMKVIMYLLPITMLFFFNSFPAGLSYYYLAANLVSIGQMWVIKNYFIDEEKILAKIESNKEKNKKKGKSKFQQRLDDMMRQKGINPPGK
ncbi:MAG: membrane protein insertase YidC [Luteibaculaceae bacterium]